MNLDRYHEHHADLRDQVQTLRRLLAPGSLEADPEAARRALVTLVARLNIHLAFEDTALYPPLLGHAEPRLRAESQRYLDGIGPVRTRVKAHLDQWLTSARVAAEPTAFRRETLALLDALQARLEAEDREFYPLLERLA